jgi:hypothetical protein
MHGNNLANIVTSVIKHFSKNITKLDAQLKFVKRKSKLGAKIFFESLVLTCLANPKASLEDMCGFIKLRGTKISKQGLHQRFTIEAATLMQNFFQKSLQQFKTEKCASFDLLKSFSSVEIIDSSIIALPEDLKDIYPGYGRNGLEAGLKIQTTYKYLHGQIGDVSITKGCKSDQGYDGYLDKIKRGALYLLDLGYFKLLAFETIAKNGAYFISKYFYATKIFDSKNKKVDLLKLLRKNKSGFAETIWLGENEKVKIRLIAVRLSDQQVNQRIRRIRENARRKGKIPTKQILELAKWSICITNIPEEMLNNKQVHILYSLRWQIELFFKLCKSAAGIDEIKSKKASRILCEIYAKLICVILLLYLCSPLRCKKNREISFIKAYKNLSIRAFEFFKAITSLHLLTKFLKSFFNHIQNFTLKDKPRRKRPLAYQKLIKSAANGASI